MTERSCDGCAKCCEGWLSGEVYGHVFYKGRPCFFLNKTCSIYEKRPDNPCRTFRCSWLAEDIFPHWMKPDLVNIIITKKQVGDLLYYEIVEAGSTIDSKTLNWLLQWALYSDNNLVYQIEGGLNRIGSQEFMKANL
jgi:uncharacterized cysteine cluster protein YcgN (CxxCxxCC family)